jgi:hypothetical protein
MMHQAGPSENAIPSFRLRTVGWWIKMILRILALLVGTGLLALGLRSMVRTKMYQLQLERTRPNVLSTISVDLSQPGSHYMLISGNSEYENDLTLLLRVPARFLQESDANELLVSIEAEVRVSLSQSNESWVVPISGEGLIEVTPTGEIVLAELAPHSLSGPALITVDVTQGAPMLAGEPQLVSVRYLRSLGDEIAEMFFLIEIIITALGVIILLIVWFTRPGRGKKVPTDVDPNAEDTSATL